MPNWVFNTVSGYTPEMFEKYKDTCTDRNGNEVTIPISFQKIIPMPEILNEIPSGSIAQDAEMLYAYQKYKDDTPEDKRSRWDHVELYDNLSHRRESLYLELGIAALNNPNQCLNSILESSEYKYQKEQLEMLRETTGNDRCRFPGEGYSYKDPNRPDNETMCKQRIEMLDRYAQCIENKHIKEKEAEDADERRVKIHNYSFGSLLKMGRTIEECKEKYGAKDWYDWRNLHWGTKWDACDAEYDEEENTVRFDTAWAPPDQIFAKMQEDFPNAKFEIYAEEETGWFNEYETKEDGKIHQITTGEYTYKEDEDGEYIQDGTDVKDVDVILTTEPDPYMEHMINALNGNETLDGEMKV